MKYIIYILIPCLFSCTYNISMVHTEGTASDVIDETSTQDVKPNLNIPVKPL